MEKKQVEKKPKKLGRWSRNTYEIATYQYMIGDRDVASIFPRETRDGKIAWGYFVKRIGSSREINHTNYSTSPVKLEAHYAKKRDVKKAIESVVGILCQ